MQKQQIFINAFMSLTQIILVSGVLFFLYKFLLKTIGVEQLGIWSLVLATTSVSQVAYFGISGSVVKFIAKYVARDEEQNVSEVIQTAVISLAIIIGIVLLLGYPLIKRVLTLVVQEDSIQSAINVLPYALLSLWLTMITSVFQSALDGFQRIYIRNILTMCGSAFFAFLCFILAPTNGLIGLAYAQVINNLTVLVATCILIKGLFPTLPFIPYRWNRSLFKEIISYGLNFQIISITQMVYDPVTKALLSKFGGLSMLGYYEMANRMIQQFRALIVSANQVLVPAFANLQETIPEKVKTVYTTSYQLLFYLSLPLFSLIIICTPLISEIWIGHYENSFMIFTILLSVGWFLNTLAAPSYFANLGIGILRWNVIGHITIAVLNAGLGVILGLLFNGYGVSVAWIIALALGSAVIYFSFHITNKIPIGDLFPRDSRAMTGFYTVILLIYLMIQPRINQSANALAFNIFLITAFLFIIFILLYHHPMRKCLTGWVVNYLLNKKRA